MANPDEHGEVTTLAQLLKRTLAQSEAFLESPPSSHALPSASSSSTSTFDHQHNQPAASTSSSSSGSTSLPSLANLLSNLSLCSSLISHLALLSSNESLSEISTATLPCLLVPYYSGMLDLQTRTRDYKDRVEVLKRAKSQLEAFRDTCDEYGLIPEQKRRELSMLAGKALPSDPMSRRDAKIKQYKEEKALKEKMAVLEQRQASKARSLASTSSAPLDDADDDEDPEGLRVLQLTRLSLAYMRAYNELNSISGEIELLQNMPHNMSELPSSSRDARQREREIQDAQWRLDRMPSSLTGPAEPHQLIDKSGRVLRPFTILPSTSAQNSLNTRLRLQDEVFQPGHNLPSMSIDDYLSIEAERGNILQGGGPKNTQEVNQERDDKKAWEEEEDNAQGERRREEKRLKDADWDEWKDSHKRGEGNRMNMG